MENKQRNDRIRRLWEAGGRTQTDIGREFGITQCRVNAIIFHRLPTYRYCNYCKNPLAKGLKKAVCDQCRATHQKRRERVRRQKQARRAKEKAKRAAKRLREQKKRDARKAKAHAKYEAKMAMWRLVRETVRQKRLQELTRRTELPKVLFPWQREGREQLRFLVRYRDNHTCQDCGKVRTPQEVAEYNKQHPHTMKSLDVHHLNGMCGKVSRGYENAKVIDNLITLCHKCHFRRHDFSKRKQWDEAKRNKEGAVV